LKPTYVIRRFGLVLIPMLFTVHWVMRFVQASCSLAFHPLLVEPA
jgi:hypothetical protein